MPIFLAPMQPVATRFTGWQVFFERIGNAMKHVIIGNGIAGTSAAESIRRFDPEGDITMIADETRLPYCRPMISHLLEGAVGPEKLPVRKKDFYEKNRVHPVLGKRVTDLDVDARQVVVAGDSTYAYDRLLLACGADPRSLDAEGADLENIFFMRTADQVEQMTRILPEVTHALVLGGGLVGFKAACGLLRRKIGVTMLIASGYPLAMQVDETAGEMIREVLVAQGLEVRTGVSVTAFEGGDRVRAAWLSDGSKISCDMAIIGKGVSPAGGFVPADRIDTETGILVNSRMETTESGIFAAGDVAECFDIARNRYQVNAIWPEAVSQGQVAGMNMAGLDIGYRGSLSRNVIRIFDLDIMSAGIVAPGGMDESCRTVALRDRRHNMYRKLVFRDNLLVGFVLAGGIEQGGILTALIQSRRPVDIPENDLASPRFDISRFFSPQRLSVS